jgi:hypothetical protein
MSECIHDKFDDLFEDRLYSNQIILTVWSEDGFADSLWEFINVHAARPDVGLAKLLIISESTLVQMGLLAEISALAWVE